MEWRPVSEKEFVNYAKGLGNYCTYGDTLNILRAVFKAFKQALGNEAEAMGKLLPASLQPLWNEAVPSGPPGGSLLGLIQAYCSLPTEKEAERALLTFFGTVKEKQAGYAAEWQQAIPGELRAYWEKSRTIDEVQDPGQCL
jgi:uncharacterized protein (DUF2267 family)